MYICNGILAAVLSSTLVYAQTTPAADTTRVRLVKEIRHEIVTLPYLDVFDDINFKIDDGTITLLGQVTRPTLKTEAENVVKELEGVNTVLNQIEVLPLSPNDDRLRRALYRAIYGSSTLFRYAMPVIKPIRIIVKNGNLTSRALSIHKAIKTWRLFAPRAFRACLPWSTIYVWRSRVGHTLR